MNRRSVKIMTANAPCDTTIGSDSLSSSRSVADDVQAMAAKRIPLARVGQPAEIVGTALYLASDASAYCTGTVIPLDGGLGL